MILMVLMVFRMMSTNIREVQLRPKPTLVNQIKKFLSRTNLICMKITRHLTSFHNALVFNSSTFYAVVLAFNYYSHSSIAQTQTFNVIVNLFCKTFLNVWSARIKIYNAVKFASSNNHISGLLAWNVGSMTHSRKGQVVMSTHTNDRYAGLANQTSVPFVIREGCNFRLRTNGA